MKADLQKAGQLTYAFFAIRSGDQEERKSAAQILLPFVARDALACIKEEYPHYVIAKMNMALDVLCQLPECANPKDLRTHPVVILFSYALDRSVGREPQAGSLDHERYRAAHSACKGLAEPLDG